MTTTCVDMLYYGKLMPLCIHPSPSFELERRAALNGYHVFTLQQFLVKKKKKKNQLLFSETSPLISAN